MAKKLLFILSLLLTVSLIIFLISFSYYKKELNNVESNKAAYEVTKDNLKNAENTVKTNRVLINEVDKDPNQLAKDANETALSVLKVLKNSESKSDIDKNQIFQSKLKNDVTTEVIDNIDLTSIIVPDDYDIEVATSRGHSIEVMVTSKDSRYLKLNYNTSNKKIDHITEYSVQT